MASAAAFDNHSLTISFELRDVLIQTSSNPERIPKRLLQVWCVGPIVLQVEDDPLPRSGRWPGQPC